jgi:hypothetical protein
MNIGALGVNALLYLGSQLLKGDSEDKSFEQSANAAANSAGPLTILPSRSAVELSFENIIAVQSLSDPAPASLTEMSATEKFLAEAQRSPTERMREQVLHDLGLTEASLAQMPAEERRVAEDKIRQLIEEKIRQAMNTDGQAPNSNSAMLQSLIGV